MKNLWQVSLGIIIALVSIGLILGGFSLSLAEGNLATAPAPTLTLTPTSIAALQPFTPSVDSPTPSPTATLTWTLTWTPSPTPTSTPCSLPVGWLYYVVGPGDTLDRIGAYYRISGTELQQANCLSTTELQPGIGIYVPPLSTQTPVPCGAPYSWVYYIVQPSDTLYRLSQAYGITVAELQRANCMGSSTLLQVGKGIYVPPWGPRIPSPTLPWIVTPTETPIETQTEIQTNTPANGLPSETPTEIPTSMPTDTPFETPTETWTPSTP
jgi:LysM repeat protein